MLITTEFVAIAVPAIVTVVSIVCFLVWRGKLVLLFLRFCACQWSYITSEEPQLAQGDRKLGPQHREVRAGGGAAMWSHDGYGSQFYDFERDPASYRLLLFCHVNDAHAALADFLQKLVSSDDVAWDLESFCGPNLVVLNTSIKTERIVIEVKPRPLPCL